MTIEKRLSHMSPNERLAWIRARRAAREIVRARKPKARTLASLARAWNIPLEHVKSAVLEHVRNERGET